MEKHESRAAGLSRRRFVQGAAAVAATTALSGGMLYGCQSNDQEGGDEPGGDGATQIYAGACRGNCAGGCALDIHVRDNIVVRTTARDLPNPAYNRICARGIAHPGRIYSAERLQYPMRRTGERGSGEFERITWDEAISEISEKWMGYAEEYGPSSMAMFTGSGNYAVCNGVAFGSASTRFTKFLTQIPCQPWPIGMRPIVSLPG